MGHRQAYYHPTVPRLLTQREAAKIQSFPNSFIFCGSVSEQWRQIGNAVPPLLGKALGRAILKMHRKAETNPSPIKFESQSLAHLRGKAFHYKYPRPSS